MAAIQDGQKYVQIKDRAKSIEQFSLLVFIFNI